jgi:hypothetical protein
MSYHIYGTNRYSIVFIEEKVILGPRNDSCTTINTTLTQLPSIQKKKLLYTEVGCVGVVLVVV